MENSNNHSRRSTDIDTRGGAALAECYAGCCAGLGCGRFFFGADFFSLKAIQAGAIDSELIDRQQQWHGAVVAGRSTTRLEHMLQPWWQAQHSAQ